MPYLANTALNDISNRFCSASRLSVPNLRQHHTSRACSHHADLAFFRSPSSGLRKGLERHVDEPAGLPVQVVEPPVTTAKTCEEESTTT